MAPTASRRIRLIAAAVAAGALAAMAFKAGWLGGNPSERETLLDPAQVIVVRTPGGLLEVSTLVKVEEFGWKTTYTCPLIDCGKLLGATVTRVRVPVHYTYRVPLAEKWELRPEGDGYVLQVPPAEPSKPAAIETAKLQVETQGGWTSPGRELNVQSTMRELGPEMDRRASQEHYLKLQEPHAAKTVGEFARKWLREQGKPAPEKLRVVFRPGAP